MPRRSPLPNLLFPLPLLSRSQSASPHHHKIQVLSDLTVQISHFSTIFKCSVNHPQPSVATVIALEPAALASDSKAHQQLHNEAGAPGHKQNVSHISHGKLQALSIVPTDSPSLFVAVCSLFSSLSPSAFFFSYLRQRRRRTVKKRIGEDKD